MVNRVVLVGRLTRDPEIRNLSETTNVLNFSLALNRTFSREEKTDFIECTAWNKTAELMAQYLGKGSLIAVDGRLQQDTYTDQQGNNRSQVVVVADTVQFLESRSKTTERVNTNTDSNPTQNTNNQTDSSDDELPW